ncbi:MAG: electron transfer flavoprotein subunit beta/FixA family protein [Candidatus Metalachnospira sp.]|nr:electron transfer flavoprotein subunit beta/FixA family protein [Candidatus Metalachnospira sp.]
MEILVCVKQVPDADVEVKLNAAGAPDVEKIAPVVNAFDGYALEMATRFKEANGGMVVVMSIGTDAVKDSMKNCLAVGADEAYIISDIIADADTLATSEVIAAAVAKLEEVRGKKFDIICCGKESTDYACGQVTQQVAEKLGYGEVVDVIGFETKDDVIAVKKETEEGYNMLEVAAPCVLGVIKPNYEPRYPTMKSKMAARKKEIPAVEVGVSATSPVKVVKVYTPAKKSAGVKIKEETNEESALKAFSMLVDAKVL